MKSNCFSSSCGVPARGSRDSVRQARSFPCLRFYSSMAAGKRGCNCRLFGNPDMNRWLNAGGLRRFGPNPGDSSLLSECQSIFDVNFDSVDIKVKDFSFFEREVIAKEDLDLCAEI